MPENNLNLVMERTKWFREDRFGMFIHWGLYAIPARGEWIRNNERLSNEDYQKYFDEWNPVDYDPKKWASLAKKAGMKYAVLTAKHHDGFCLFDSKYTEYKSTNTQCGRDLVREYIDAFRAEGIKIGIYYSLLDWHHEDYPKYNDGIHPMRGNEAYKDIPYNFDNYTKYLHNQVEEICTNYGKIDILWFDFSYNDMCGEKWKATELLTMVRKLQPEVIVDNRLEGSGIDGNLVKEEITYCCGDFLSPEQIIPPKGIVNVKGEQIPWEACITMNDNWGYSEFGKNFKPSNMLIKKLVECVSKNGNLLLNVGPDAKGNIPTESIKILNEIGCWMEKNYNSIYNCYGSDLEKPEFGRITQNGKKLYIHVMEGIVGHVYVSGLPSEKIKKVRMLATGAELPVVVEWNTTAYPDYTFINVGSCGTFANNIQENTDVVIEIELK